MNILLLCLALGWVLGLTTWLFYLAAQSLMPRKLVLNRIVLFHAYLLVAIGLVLDFLLNVLVASALFLAPPQELLLTKRLVRYKYDERERAWRRRLAGWICAELLDTFAADGCHCSQD